MKTVVKRVLFLACCLFFPPITFGADEKYPELVLPDKSDRAAFKKKLDEVCRLLRPTTWGHFPHEFASDAEKEAYRRRLYSTIIDGYVEWNAMTEPDEILPMHLYRIASAYRELYNNVPDAEKPEVLAERKKTIHRYETIEPLKATVAEIDDAALVFPFALEVVNRGTTEFIKRSDAEQKDFLRRFYDFLDTHRSSDGPYFMDIVDDIVYGATCYLESLAANDPNECDYVVEALKKYVSLLQGRSRGKSMGKIVERLEMKGKPCPWKLPVFGSEETVDFSTRKDRISLITFFPVYTSHTLHLQYAKRLWHEKGLDIYNVDHRPSDYLRSLLPTIGLDWPVFHEIPQNIPDAEDYYFLKRWLGVFENDEICILVDRDGTVLDANLLQKNAIPALEKIFGTAPYDISKKAGEFTRNVADGKLEELFESSPKSEWAQRLADVALVAYKRSGGGEIAHGESLIRVAMNVYEQSGTEEGRKQAVGVLAAFAQWNNLFEKDRKERLAEIIQQLEADGHPRLADKLRWVEYRSRFNYEMATDEFLKERDALFTYLLEHPESVVPDELYPLLSLVSLASESAAYRAKDKTIMAETSLACAKMLAGSSNKEVAQLAEFLYAQARRLMLPGKEMPLDGITLDGKTFDPEAYRGKILLVDFWATWCGYCIAEFPAVKKLYGKYREKGFEVIGISTDESLDVLRGYLQKNPLPWPVFADKKLEEAGMERMDKRYGISAIPEVILIGRDGKVIMLEARGEALAEKLAELFPEEKRDDPTDRGP